MPTTCRLNMCWEICTSEDEAASFSSIKNSFSQFYYVFYFLKRCKCPQEEERDEYYKNIAASFVAVALLSLSTTTKNIKESVHFYQ
ncbi:hypothetical protein TorRG33x02_154230 [Trema orientale]|uniref:Uncharacterized protein n=1 Tax=Trema orientale TaxID=63057 RepID=A0A2P5ET69_TREOI|nr:hypothetical protein TorRG33x02_154230 [Trema orientale]